MRLRPVIVLVLLTWCFSWPEVLARKAVKPELASSVQPVLSETDRMAFDYYFQSALGARQLMRIDDAFDLFSHSQLIDSLDAQAWYEKAIFFGNMKRSDLALEAMEHAHRLDPSNDWYVFGLANMYLNLKMVPRAIALYEDLLRVRPDDENLLYQMAVLYARTDNPQAALRCYSQVEALVGKNDNVSLEKYKLYKAMGKPRKAIREIQTLCAENPYDIDYMLLLGDAWMDLGYSPEALAQYQKAEELDPNEPSVALSLADYYNETGDSLAANKQLMKALTNPDTDFDTKFSIFGPMLSNAMVGPDSVRIPGYFDLLLDQHPNEYRIRELHVQYLLHKGQKKEAKEELRTALNLNPAELQTWRLLLELSAEAENQKEIRSICESALEHFPQVPVFWFYLGLSWYPDSGITNDPDATNEAIKSFRQAIAVSKPEDGAFISRLYGLIGDGFMQVGEKDSAYANYDKALDVHPGNILVLNNYAYYLSEENEDLPRAEKMSRKTVDAEPTNSTYLDTYAWIFFKQEKYGLAKIYIERAIANQAQPETAILEHYGDILWFLQEKGAALEQWKKASELGNPSPELVEKVSSGQYVKTIKTTK